MGDHLIGLVGDGYVMIAADTSASRSIIRFKDNEDKILVLDKYKMLAGSGPTGDRNQFSEYIEKNVHLHQLRTGLQLSTNATANFTRNQLAHFLRSNPYQVNLLLGGYDEGKGPSLFYLDYLGAMHRVDKGAHGYAAYFAPSTLDRYWKKDMTVEEGKEVLRKVIHGLRTRMVLDIPKFQVKIADKDGIRDIQL